MNLGVTGGVPNRIISSPEYYLVHYFCSGAELGAQAIYSTDAIFMVVGDEIWQIAEMNWWQFARARGPCSTVPLARSLRGHVCIRYMAAPRPE
ncbi:hypothetical protein [Sphingopyxis sp. Root154]|uniref:hypothetical protein n=1 Tax=Sphingopyxis sp. Root154 TaxID=1736476 RepID=UPI00138F6B3B|nr:hypothetical protein [Sphingopyxis sp. Root154]